MVSSQVLRNKAEMAAAMGHPVKMEGEEHGLSVLFRIDDDVFHTYSAYARWNRSRTPMISSTPRPGVGSRTLRPPPVGLRSRPTQAPNRFIDMTRAVGGDRMFFVTVALVFLSSVAATTYLCRSMSGGMPMPGGWTMSMPWMKMPEQTWPGAAAAFECSWLLMMNAMMLPSLVPMLSAYRCAVRRLSGNERLLAPTILVGPGISLSGLAWESWYTRSAPRLR
jgi:hypothetical protein